MAKSAASPSRMHRSPACNAKAALKYNLVAGRYHSDDASQRPLMMQLSLMRGFAHNPDTVWRTAERGAIPQPLARRGTGGWVMPGRSRCNC